MSKRGSGASHASHTSYSNALSPKSHGSNSSYSPSSKKGKWKYKHSRSLNSTASSNKGLLPEKVLEHRPPDVSKLRVAFSETRNAVSDDKSMGVKTTFQSVAQNLSKSIRKINLGRGFLDVLRSKDVDDNHEQTVVIKCEEEPLVETASPSCSSSKPKGRTLFKSKALMVARTTFAFRNKTGGSEDEMKIDGHMALRRKSVAPALTEQRTRIDSEKHDEDDDSCKSECSSRSSTKPDSDAWVKITNRPGLVHDAGDGLGLTMTAATLGKRLSLTNVVPVLRTPDPMSGGVLENESVQNEAKLASSRVLENWSVRSESKSASTERETHANVELQNPTVCEAVPSLVADLAATGNQETHSSSKPHTYNIHQMSNCIDAVDLGFGQHYSSQEKGGDSSSSSIDEVALGLSDHLTLQQKADGIDENDEFSSQLLRNAPRELLRSQLGSSISCNLKRTGMSSSQDAFGLDDRLNESLELPPLSSTGARERARLMGLRAFSARERARLTGRRAFVDESLLESEILQASTQRSRPFVTALRSIPSFHIPFTAATKSDPPRLLTPQRAQGRRCFKRDANMRSATRLQANFTKPKRLDMLADNACIWKVHCKEAGTAKRSESGGVYEANVVRSAFAHRGFVDVNTAPQKTVPWRGNVELNIWGWEARDLWEASDVACMVPSVPSLQVVPDGFDAKSQLGEPLHFEGDSSSGSRESIDLDTELSALYWSNEGGDSFARKSSRNCRSISAMLGR